MPVFVRFQGWAARRGWQFDRVLIVHNSTHGVYIAHAYAGFVGGVDDLDLAAQVKLRYCQACVLARFGIAFAISGQSVLSLIHL